MKSIINLIQFAEKNKNTNQYKKIGNHSVTVYANGNIDFKYFSTIICAVKNGNITYDNGGYETMSTKRAINAYKRYFAD